jgi:hypothetical protein
LFSEKKYSNNQINKIMFNAILQFVLDNKYIIATTVYETAARAFPTKKDITLTNVIKTIGVVALSLLDKFIPNKAVDNETHG